MPLPRKKESNKPAAFVTYEKCWAKTHLDGSPGIGVYEHCLNVGTVAERILSDLAPNIKEKLDVRSAVLLTALHDIGKVSPGFQTKCVKWLQKEKLTDTAQRESWCTANSDHAKISQWTVQNMMGSSRYALWAAVLGAHHGRPKGHDLGLMHMGHLGGQGWEEERKKLVASLKSVFQSELSGSEPDMASLWFVAGLITVSDWIGSDETFFPQNLDWDIPVSREKADIAVTSLNWGMPTIKPDLTFEDLFDGLGSSNPMQKTVMSTVTEPGVYVIEASMGCGKTEAALAAAYQIMSQGKASGIYFALPTQVTSNRIYVRTGKFIERILADSSTNIKLAHANSWLVEESLKLEFRESYTGSSTDDDAEQAREHVMSGRSWFASSKRALLAPFGVGTIDQALLGIVAAKHFFVRQFALAGKVVILDEVHSYDLYTGTLIDQLITRLRELQCTVIILSATLTRDRRRQLLGKGGAGSDSIAYPLVSGVKENGDFFENEVIRDEVGKNVKIHCETRPESGIVDECLKRAAEGQCVIWIRNTVGEAQETYRALNAGNYQGGPLIGLLHSRFPVFRREELEDNWLGILGKNGETRPSGCVLVSTQVVEQSVDIDADFMITDLAPTDMMLQRMGRLWRHKRHQRPVDRPELWVRVPSVAFEILREMDSIGIKKLLGKSARIYSPYVLCRSLEQWQARECLSIPDDIRPLLEETYSDKHDDESAAIGELYQEMEVKKQHMASQAMQATAVLGLPTLKDEEGVQTRYNSFPTTSLLLLSAFPEDIGVGKVRLKLLNGEECEVGNREFSFTAARAIHWNLVRIPRWPFNGVGLTPPLWLKKHIFAECFVGICDRQNNGTISFLGLENGRTPAITLNYHPDEGLVMDAHSKTQTRRVSDETEDEFDD